MDAEQENPRWLACARAIGCDPDELRALDFILWMGPVLSAARKADGVGPHDTILMSQDELTAFVQRFADQA